MNDAQSLIVLMVVVLACSYLGRQVYRFLASMSNKGSKGACGDCSGCAAGTSKVKVVELVGLDVSPAKSSPKQG